jgi:serine protease
MKNLLLILFSACTAILTAQSTSAIATRLPGNLLIQVQKGFPLNSIVDQLGSKGIRITQIKNTAPDWGIYNLVFEETESSDLVQIMREAQSTSGIQTAQWNRKTQERSITPNDPEFSRQDGLTLIGAPDAWAFATGGVMYSRDSIKGDTIVVAILEKGALLTHPDLIPNRWYNYQEIPNNNIDDDGNGFVDDFKGWNPRLQNDDVEGSKGNHGTMVTGVIGAKGNNGIGISGVNWNIKLMNLANIEYEDEIIEGYSYVHKMRQIYNRSNGAKGAFVVATNASFGLDTEWAQDYPLWCAVYDSLGKEGVVSIAATTNANADVDMVGDMPTTCLSEYLIAVTNVDKFGQKEPAGYGATYIDLGAPGNATFSTSNSGGNPSYGVLGGTSLATPHVTGAVALLYSMGCKFFTQDALSDPSACASRVRDVIKNNTESDNTLRSITTTGGYLSISNSVNSIFEFCKSTVGPLAILTVNTFTNTDRYQVFYQTPNFVPYNFRIYNMLGQQLYETTIQPLQFQENFVEFKVSDFPAGVYQMVIGRGKIGVSRKFVKI